MNLAGGLITKGLGLDACRGLVINSLGVTPLLRIEVRSGGGPYPYPAWNKVDSIQNFYKDIDFAKYQEVPDYQYPKEYVKIAVTLGSKEFEREYLLDKKNTKRIVQIVSIINATYENVVIRISNLKRRIHDIIVRVRDMRRVK